MGIREYGGVLFADPVKDTYPVDTPERIHAAWSSIHHQRAAAFYASGDAASLDRRTKTWPS